MSKNMDSMFIFILVQLFNFIKYLESINSKIECYTLCQECKQFMKQPSRMLFRVLLQKKKMVSETFIFKWDRKWYSFFPQKLIPNQLNKFESFIKYFFFNNQIRTMTCTCVDMCYLDINIKDFHGEIYTECKNWFRQTQNYGQKLKKSDHLFCFVLN